MITFLSTIVFLPAIDSSRFSPASSAGNSIAHCPFSSALVSALPLASVTCTSSPASAQPHTRIVWSRWNIMLSVKIFGRRTSARATDPPSISRPSADRATNLFLQSIFKTPLDSGERVWWNQTKNGAKTVRAACKACKRPAKLLPKVSSSTSMQTGPA